MATRSLIGIQTENGYRATYCYSGGTPDWNGAILLQHYRDPAKLNELLDGGPMSTLGPTATTPPDASWLPDDIHAATRPLDSITRHYRSQIGSTRADFPDFTGERAPDFWSIEFTHGPDYYYLLTPDGWYVSCKAERDTPPQPLAYYLIDFLDPSYIDEHDPA